MPKGPSILVCNCMPLSGQASKDDFFVLEEFIHKAARNGIYVYTTNPLIYHELNHYIDSDRITQLSLNLREYLLNKLEFDMILGIASGPNQSASRSLMGRIIPDKKTNEFYGFYAFSGKATSFAGFLILLLMILITGSQEIGMLVVSLLLIGGIYLLDNVKDYVEEK